MVLAFPGLLNLAQGHLLSGNSEFTCRSASHELTEGVHEHAERWEPAPEDREPSATHRGSRKGDGRSRTVPDLNEPGS